MHHTSGTTEQEEEEEFCVETVGNHLYTEYLKNHRYHVKQGVFFLRSLPPPEKRVLIIAKKNC